MRSVAVLLALTLAACSPEAEVTDSTNKCVTNLYPSYNSKLLDQCVRAGPGNLDRTISGISA